MLFKNILFGLGSVGVVGGGGYMIYNATKSGDYKSVEVKNRKESKTKAGEKEQTDSETQPTDDARNDQTSGTSPTPTVSIPENGDQETTTDNNGLSSGITPQPPSGS